MRTCPWSTKIGGASDRIAAVPDLVALCPRRGTPADRRGEPPADDVGLRRPGVDGVGDGPPRTPAARRVLPRPRPADRGLTPPISPVPGVNQRGPSAVGMTDSGGDRRTVNRGEHGGRPRAHLRSPGRPGHPAEPASGGRRAGWRGREYG